MTPTTTHGQDMPIKEIMLAKPEKADDFALMAEKMVAAGDALGGGDSGGVAMTGSNADNLNSAANLNAPSSSSSSSSSALGFGAAPLSSLPHAAASSSLPSALSGSLSSSSSNPSADVLGIADAVTGVMRSTVAPAERFVRRKFTPALGTTMILVPGHLASQWKGEVFQITTCCHSVELEEAQKGIKFGKMSALHGSDPVVDTVSLTSFSVRHV
jgi:hypothetical protein